MSCSGDTNFGFSNENPLSSAVNYLANIFFENLDESCKFKGVVFQLFNFVYILRTMSLEDMKAKVI